MVGSKHLDPSYFCQITAYDEMTPIMNWELRLTRLYRTIASSVDKMLMFFVKSVTQVQTIFTNL